MKDLQVETHTEQLLLLIILIIRNPFKLLVHALYRIHVHKCTYKGTRISSSRYIVDSITSVTNKALKSCSDI